MPIAQHRQRALQQGVIDDVEQLRGEGRGKISGD
jgi:hypothetical protein